MTAEKNEIQTSLQERQRLAEAEKDLVSRTEAERDYLKDGDHLDVEEEDLMQDVIFGRTTAFWVDFLEIDCAEYLKEVQKPVLILQGENDYMITMDADYSVWQEEMEDEIEALIKSDASVERFLLAGNCNSSNKTVPSCFGLAMLNSWPANCQISDSSFCS